MKKIINSKIYDTKKAELIDQITDSNIHNKEVKVEKLYKTKNWEYFLYYYWENMLLNDLWKLWKNIKIMSLIDILKWIEKHQIVLLSKEEQSVFKEFWKYFLQ